MSLKQNPGLSLHYLTNTLESVIEPKTYTQYKETSGIKLKSSFFKYTKWCKEKGFIETKRIPFEAPTGRFENICVKRRTVYQTTPQGLKFLEMIK